jgi:NADH-quinone oxidoreductase subunit E
MPKPGPQVDRQLSAPVGGLTTLTDPTLYGQAANDDQPAGGSHTHGGAALTDDAAKRPGEPASRRDEPAPKPPAADTSAEQQSGRRE